MRIRLRYCLPPEIVFRGDTRLPFVRGHALSNVNSQLLNFACPKCQKKLKAPANLAGQKLVCPKCSAPIRVPGVVETKNDDDEWLALNEPSKLTSVSTPEKRQAIKPKTKASEPSSPPKPPQSTEADPDEFRLAPPEKTGAPHPSPSVASSQSTTRRSVFDDDLPELAPIEETPAAPTVESKSKSSHAQAAKTKLSLPDIALPELDLSDIPLAPIENPKSQTRQPTQPKRPLLVGSLEELTLESPALIGPMASLIDEEFTFPCKVCGSLLGSSRSRIGTETRCPDCFSQFSVPSPPQKKKLSNVRMDDEVAHVNLAPLDSLIVQGASSSVQKTKEILERAEQTLESERGELDHLNGTFDTKRWFGLLFGFLRDPMVIAAAVGIGFLTGFWLFSIAAMGTWVQLDGMQVVLAKLILLCVFCLPIAGLICMCGIAILTMAANRASRVLEWPFMKPFESFGECAMVLASVIAASIPGGMVGAAFRAFNSHPMVALAFAIIGIWGLTPILLLCMIDNGSIFEPYSKAVFSSIKSHTEAWGAMYMQTGMVQLMFFLFMLATNTQSPLGDFVLGLFLPLTCFFVFNQYGVLAGRISQVTGMGFEGDFSED